MKDNFFSKDKRVYDIKHNREFLSWYKNKIRNGYHPTLTIDEIEKLINYISMWYFIKLPDQRYLEKEGVKNLDFANLRDISLDMGFIELLYRFPKNALDLFKGMYRSKHSGSIPVMNGEEIIKYNPIIGIEISKNKMSDGAGLSSIILEADANTGIISGEELKKNFPNVMMKSINIENLYTKLNETNNYNLDHLNNILLNHQIDDELRSRIIFYTSLKILYNNSSIPNYNYLRAVEFNKELEYYLKLNIDTKYLDDLINKEKETNKVKHL